MIFAGAPWYFWRDVDFRPRVTAGLGNGGDLAHPGRHGLMYRADTSIVPLDVAISPVATVDQPRLPLAQATHQVFFWGFFWFASTSGAGAEMMLASDNSDGVTTSQTKPQ
jgi:hypothetical protein